MKKVIAAFLLVLILAIMLGTAYATQPEMVHLNVLITDYELVERVTFIVTDNHGNEFSEEISDISIEEKTKIPSQRIINYTPYLDGEYYWDAEEGHFVIVVKMNDGREFASEELEGKRLYKDYDYVFNVRKERFEDRKIWSEYPDIYIGIMLFLMLGAVSVVLAVIKCIFGAVIRIKPYAELVASALISCVVLFVNIMIFYIFIPIDVVYGAVYMLFGTAYFEYVYIKSRCKETTHIRKIIYVIAANTLGIAGAVYYILSYL